MQRGIIAQEMIFRIKLDLKRCIGHNLDKRNPRTREKAGSRSAFSSLYGDNLVHGKSFL